ncbi:hypothetical protein [Rodentibacter abscessus]
MYPLKNNGFLTALWVNFDKKRADYSRFWDYAKDENKIEGKKVDLV